VATDREWANAYRAQAAADLEAARLLQGEAPSVLAMLLQMVLEKLAKAALLRSGAMTFKNAARSHVAASRMILVLKRNQHLLAGVGDRGSHAWKDVLPIVQELERSHPQLAAGRPQLEYPWQDTTTGEVRWPAKDLPIANRFADPKSTEAARTTRFAMELNRAFDGLFP